MIFCDFGLDSPGLRMVPNMAFWHVRHKYGIISLHYGMSMSVLTI